MVHGLSQVFFATLCIFLASVNADEKSHQTIQHGHAPPHGHQITKGHHDSHAIVHQQPHTAPQDVHNPYHGKEKYHVAAVHPAHGPTYKVPIVSYVPHKSSPAPQVVYKQAPPPKVVYKTVQPTYRPAPKAPTYKTEPVYDTPAYYSYEYAVNDDYAKTHFNANEARDGYTTNGEYRVLLPDGRVQKVTYTVDAYNGKHLS